MIEYGNSKPGAEWTRLQLVKSIQTLFEFVEKLVNLDEKVIWSFLTLIAKNKLDEKRNIKTYWKPGPILMNARMGLILVLDRRYCIPLYLVKIPFWDSYYRFWHFILTFLLKKKIFFKKPTLFFQYFGSVGKGQTNMFF